MVGRTLWIGFVLVTLAWSWSSDDVQPPVKCRRDNAGTFWPEAANTDAAVRNRALRCGALLYCSRTKVGWKWQPMTVTLQSLIAKAAGKEQTSADDVCNAGPATPDTKAEKEVGRK
jgi:hypothetical protein